MSAHTPGPWQAVKDQFGDWMIENDNTNIADVPDFEDERADESNANARLIAAAPELLEALVNLLAVVRGEGGTQPDAQGIAERAIAKATGGQP